MAGVIEQLKVSKEVAGGEMECDEITPGAGKSITVLSFEGSAAYTQNCVVRLTWDDGGASEETVWTIKGEFKLPHKATISGADGVKKLSLCCENGETGSVWMSGYAEVLVE